MGAPAGLLALRRLGPRARLANQLAGMRGRSTTRTQAQLERWTLALAEQSMMKLAARREKLKAELLQRGGVE